MKRVCGFGEVIDGKLVLRNRETFDAELKKLKGRVEVTVEKAQSRRSLNQNAYYWGVVVKLISEHTGYEQEEVHALLKQMFNPKEMPVRDKWGFENEARVGASTSQLSTLDFEVYLERIRRWAAMTLGVVIPDPGESVNLTDDGDEPKPMPNEDDPRLTDR